MTANSKYRGSLKLSAIGDSLGWMTEFDKSNDRIKNKYHVDAVDKFYAWEKQVGGRFNGYVDKMKAGSYSDDTQLLLSVARSIRQDGGVDQTYFAKIELPEWLDYSRGAGRTIKNAARKIQRKSADWNNNFFKFKAGKTTIDYRDSGANGAAMRVLPIALANFGNPEKIRKEIFCNSIITHGHPRAIVGAMLYGDAINTVLRFTPETFNFTQFLTELGRDIQLRYNFNLLHNEALLSWENKWNLPGRTVFRDLFSEVLNECQNYLRDAYRFINNNTSTYESLSQLGCFKPETKGSGLSTVIAGIYLAAKYDKSPLQAINESVNAFGADTDSIAAFAGGLIGALHGHSIVPRKWRNVQDYKYLDFIAGELLKISEGNSDANYTATEKTMNIPNLLKDEEIIEGKEVNLLSLGKGVITYVEIQSALSKNRSNIIYDVEFEIGQTCRFSRLVNNGIAKISNTSKDSHDLILIDCISRENNQIINKFYSELDEHKKKDFLRIMNMF